MGDVHPSLLLRWLWQPKGYAKIFIYLILLFCFAIYCSLFRLAKMNAQIIQRRYNWNDPLACSYIYLEIICVIIIGKTIHVPLLLSELELDESGPIKREDVNMFKIFWIYHCKHVPLPPLLCVEANRLRLHYILSLCSETCRSPGIKILNSDWFKWFICLHT